MCWLLLAAANLDFVSTTFIHSFEYKMQKMSDLRQPLNRVKISSSLKISLHFFILLKLSLYFVFLYRKKLFRFSEIKIHMSI